LRYFFSVFPVVISKTFLHQHSVRTLAMS
jgi:hypothetical protein